MLSACNLFAKTALFLHSLCTELKTNQVQYSTQVLGGETNFQIILTWKLNFCNYRRRVRSGNSLQKQTNRPFPPKYCKHIFWKSWNQILFPTCFLFSDSGLIFPRIRAPRATFKDVSSVECRYMPKELQTECKPLFKMILKKASKNISKRKQFLFLLSRAELYFA